MNLLKNKEYLRSILFGIEDSLISTTGLIAGISLGSEDKKFVILAGIVAVAIEAVSMGAGEYLSDEAVEEMDEAPTSLRSGYLLPTLRRERNPSEAKSSLSPSSILRSWYFAKGDKQKRHRENPLMCGVLLTISYVIAGIVPLAPVVFFGFPTSIVVSAILALICLFFVGFMKGKIVKVNPIRSGVKILLVGGVTTLLGLLVGMFFRY